MLRSFGSFALLLVAVLCIGVGALSMWMKLQVFDTDTWVETSRAAIQQPEVQTAVAEWSVDQVYDLADPDALIAKLLPPRAAALAGPLSARLRTEAYELAEKAVASPQVEEIWVKANERAHTRFMRIIDGTEPIVVETSGGITIDLRPLLERIAERIGLDGKLVEKIPQNIAQVTPKRSAEMERGLEILRLLNDWGRWITFFALPFLALGVWLAPNRRRAWMWTGVGVILVSIGLEYARDALGPVIAGLLTVSTTWNAAILATWDVTSGTLDDAAVTGVIIGVATIVLAWTTGPSGPARSMRGFLKPVLVDRPAIGIGVCFLLAFIAINSIDAVSTRRVGVQALLVLGATGAGWALSRVARRDAAVPASTSASVEAPSDTVDASSSEA